MLNILSEADWLAALRKAIPTSEVGFQAGDSALERSAIFRIWLLLTSNYAGLRGAYESLTDADIETSRDAALRVVPSSFPQLPQSATFQDGVLFAAGLLRALERRHIEFDASSLPRRASDMRVEAESELGWFVPIAPRYRPPGQTSRRSFAKRGLVHCRIFPQRLSTGQTVRVELATASATQRSDVDALRLGGGLLESWQAAFKKPPPRPGEFLVDDWTCASLSDQLSEIVRQAAKEKCHVLVLPELCVPPNGFTSLVDLYARRQTPNGQRIGVPPVTIAGSWHELDPLGAMRNLSRVLLPSGKEVAQYAKMFAYYDAKYGREHIVDGTEVLVIIAAEAVYATAICLDFCTVDDKNPFPSLDVDVVLVPSCADGETAEKHAAAAALRYARTRAPTFVVQQHNDNAERFGFIYPRTDAADGDFRVDANFALRML